jgi:hypothetical protein
MLLLLRAGNEAEAPHICISKPGLLFALMKRLTREPNYERRRTQQRSIQTTKACIFDGIFPIAPLPWLRL